MTTSSISERPKVLSAAAPAATVVREILFPSDLSAGSDVVFGHARMLAERCQAHLSLFHALQISRADELAGPSEPRWEQRRRAERSAYEHLLGETERLQTRHGVYLERAPSARAAILEFIGKTRPELVVMATSSRVGMSKLVLGSTTQTVIEAGGAPVLCVREPDHGRALPYRRILVPTDLSLVSRRPFALAGVLARAFDADVVALHVAAVPGGRTTAGVADVVDRQVPSEQALLAFLMPELDGVRVEPRIEFGSAWERIVAVAREERADLIALSTHGPDSLADRVLGTHAEQVVRESPCPVLIA
jgi:nucleotide-binding universal stress UspA family protein